MKENIEKLRDIANDMLVALSDQPNDLDENERLWEQLQFLAEGNIPARTVSEWAVKLSELAQGQSSNLE